MLSRMSRLSFLLCILINFFINSNTYSKCTDKPITIAVVDTGFGFEGRGETARLCKEGHRDFSSEHLFADPTKKGILVPLDIVGHGTNITGIIEEYAKKSNINYCIVVIKYYNHNRTDNLKTTIDAFRYARDSRLDYINYSGGGPQPSSAEREAILGFIDNGGIIVVAAGNSGFDMDIQGNDYYPAKYDRRIVVVGALNDNGRKTYFSNYGSVVSRWELGMMVTGYGITMSGTSQATAVGTGRIVSQSQNTCGVK